MTAPGASPLRGVILHATADEQFRERLDTHLNVIKERVKFWSPHNIQAGRDRHREIAKRIDQADILVLLLSPDFLASEMWNEWKETVKKAQLSGAYLVPIRLRPCLWEASEFREVQLLPRVGRDVGRPDNDDCWVTICQEIKSLLDGRYGYSVPPPRDSTGEEPPTVRTRTTEVPATARAARQVASPLRLARAGLGFSLLVAIGVGIYLLLPISLPPPPPIPRPDGGPPRPPIIPPLPVPTEAHPSLECPEGMTKIPAGVFRMGGFEANQTPLRDVQLNAFCLDRTEVTVARYSRCVASGKCPAAGTSDKCNAARAASRSEHPINCLQAADAEAFCKTVAGRLPTEAEWEYAARSGGKYLYPWGDHPPDPTKLATQQEEICWRGEETCKVNSHPRGQTLGFPVLGMAGNVAEWVADSYSENYDPNLTNNPLFKRENSPRVTRGGSFGSENNGKLRTVYRGHYSPTGRLPEVGFRCAAPAH